MKKPLFKSFYLLLLSSLFFTACNPEDLNNLLITRDNYIGSWSVSDREVPVGKNNYTANILADENNSSQVIIRNFHQFGSSYFVYGIVAGKNLTIPSRDVLGNTVYGDGVLSGNKLTITYFVDDGADLKKYIADYTR